MAHLLVVDDSGTIRTILKKILEGAGHQVSEAEDGADALGKLGAQETLPDIILSDVNMPNMDGLTMSSKIKQDAKLKSIPIVVISTELGGDMKAKGKEIGVTAWMSKPANPEKLLEVVGKIMTMKKG